MAEINLQFTYAEYDSFHDKAITHVEEFFDRSMEFVTDSKMALQRAAETFQKMLETEDPPSLVVDVLWQVCLFGLGQTGSALIAAATPKAKTYIQQLSAKSDRMARFIGALKFFETERGQEWVGFGADQLKERVGSAVEELAKAPFMGGEKNFEGAVDAFTSKLNGLREALQNQRHRWKTFVNNNKLVDTGYVTRTGMARISPINKYVARCLELPQVSQAQLDNLPKSLEKELWKIYIATSVTVVKDTLVYSNGDSFRRDPRMEGLNKTQFKYVREMFPEIKNEDDLVTLLDATKKLTTSRGSSRPAKFY